MKRSVLATVLLVMMATPALAIDLLLWAHPSFTPAAGLPAVAEAYQRAYDQFHEEYPDINLGFEVSRGGTEALQQFLTAAGSGNLPDLALLDGFWIARLVETGELQPLNELWDEESRSHWLEQSVEAVTLDGNVYAVPFHTSWRGLFYPVERLDALGYDTPPATWDQFLEFAAAAKNAGMHATMWPAVGNNEVTALHMLSMFWGLGGELVDESGKPVFFEGKNREALETVYSLYLQLIEAGYMPQDVTTLSESGIRPYFYAAETATAAASSSHVTTFYTDNPALEGNLGAFNYPLPDGASAVPALTGFTYGIFTSDPERQEAAWKFIEFINRPEIIGTLNAEAGHIPVVNEVWDQEFYRDDPLMQQFRAIVESGRMKPRPPVPIYPVITNAWSSELAGVIAGSITPSEAVDNAREVVMAEYERLMAR
jgi:multiple sugar transport system substrate-binding protein